MTPWKTAPEIAALEYEDLGAVAFTGGLLAARNFIQQLYVHMGFHPAWKYETVVELLLDDGRVLGQFDRSAAIAAVRERITAKGAGSSPRPGISHAELEKWIADTFRLDYRLGLGIDSE